MIKRIFILCALVNIAFQIFILMPIQSSRHDDRRDSVIYYQAAVDTAHQRTPYHAPINYNPNEGPMWYVYSPEFAVALTPLARLSYFWFARLSYIPVLLGFWAYAWSLSRISRARPTVEDTLLWGLVLGLTPGVYFSLSCGQMDLVMWALFGLAVALENPIFLAFGSHIKVFTLVPMLVQTVLKTKNRPAAWAIVAAGLVLGLIGLGIGGFVDWGHTLRLILTEGTFNKDNYSLSVASLRVLLHFGLWHYTGGPLPTWAHAYLSSMQLLGPAVILYLCRKFDRQSLTAIAGLATVLFSPLCWGTYLIMGYVLAALAIRRHFRPSGEEIPVETSVSKI